MMRKIVYRIYTITRPGVVVFLRNGDSGVILGLKSSKCQSAMAKIFLINTASFLKIVTSSRKEFAPLEAYSFLEE